MLVDFTHGFMSMQAQYTANIVSRRLPPRFNVRVMHCGRKASPIPDEVKKGRLIPPYSPEALENVRYVIADVSPSGLAGFAIRNDVMRRR